MIICVVLRFFFCIKYFPDGWSSHVSLLESDVLALANLNISDSFKWSGRTIKPSRREIGEHSSYQTFTQNFFQVLSASFFFVYFCVTRTTFDIGNFCSSEKENKCTANGSRNLFSYTQFEVEWYYTFSFFLFLFFVFHSLRWSEGSRYALLCFLRRSKVNHSASNLNLFVFWEVERERERRFYWKI